MDWNIPLTVSVSSTDAGRSILERRRSERERRARRIKFWQAAGPTEDATKSLKPTVTLSSLSKE